jgi:hypothetical protein
VQAHDLEKQAEALTARASEIRRAGQRVCLAIDNLVAEQSQLALALDVFCAGEDEESLKIGCPLLRKFVEFFQEINAEHSALSKEIQGGLVQAVDSELGRYLQAIKEGRKALSRTETTSDAPKSLKFRPFSRNESPNVRVHCSNHHLASRCTGEVTFRSAVAPCVCAEMRAFFDD